MGVIFVAGVHGVGKTTSCADVAKRLVVPHYTASGIIRSAKESAISGSTKEVGNVRENQELLIEGVNRILESGSQRMILDGHFTILDKQGKINPIESKVFASFKMDGVVVYKDEPERICERLEERDSKRWDIALLREHQLAELEHANNVSMALRVPITVLDAFDSTGLSDVACGTWGLMR